MRASTRVHNKGLRNASNITQMKAKNMPAIPRGICLKIPCTDCGAQIDELCISNRGNVTSRYHKARIHQAMRKWHAERETNTVELPPEEDR